MTGDKPSRTVTYLFAIFPALSHTFLHDELREVERQGIPVVPISVNAPLDIDLLDETNRTWARRTSVLKGAPALRVASAFFRAVIRDPAILFLPFRLGGLDLAELMRRTMYLVEACLVVDIMRRADSRHIHAHFGGPVSTVAMLATEIGNRIDGGRPWTWSLTIHGWSEFVAEERNLLRRKVHTAEFTACVSYYTQSQLMRLAGPERWDTIHVVRCGIDLERFTQRPPQDASANRVLVVGRLSPEKGHRVLVDALALVEKSGVRVDVDLVGPDQGAEGPLLDRINELELTDRFHFHGPRSPEEVIELLRAADVFCLPTFAEGLPVVLMEAMAIGVPTVTTYIAGIPELAIDERTALVVPASDHDALAGALTRMLTDAELRHRLIDAARLRVSEQHDLTKTSLALADLLRGVLGRTA